MQINDLVRQIQQGKTELYSELWEQKRKLISWYAKRFYSLTAGNGVSLGVEFETQDGERRYLEDFEQAGFLGLVNAVEHYDPDRNGSFNQLLKLCVLKEFLATTSGRSKKQRTDPLLNCLSLDVPLYDDEPEGSTLIDAVPDTRNEISEAEERVFQEQLHDALEKALNMIPENEARAIRLEFWEGRKQTETAEALGVSHQRVHQLRNGGLQHIRCSSAGKELEKYIDLNTDFYKGIGNQLFKKKGSQVERLVIYRETLREVNSKRIFEQDRIDE